MPARPDDDPLGLAEFMLGWSLASPALPGDDGEVGEPLLEALRLADGEPDVGVGFDGEPDPFDGLAGLEAFDEDAEPLAELDAVADDAVGTGGWGGSGGAFWNNNTAMSTAIAASSTMSSQLTRMVIHPARSCRPGQGSGQSRPCPGALLSIQERR